MNELEIAAMVIENDRLTAWCEVLEADSRKHQERANRWQLRALRNSIERNEAETRAEQAERDASDIAEERDIIADDWQKFATRASSWWEAAKTLARANAYLNKDSERLFAENCDLYEKVESWKNQANSNHERQLAVADERDAWVGQAIGNHTRAEQAEQDASDIADERDYWKNRAEITHLQHVAANKRAEEAEADRDGAESRIEELKYQIKILDRDLRHKTAEYAELNEAYDERDAEVAAYANRVADLQNQVQILKYTSNIPNAPEGN